MAGLIVAALPAAALTQAGEANPSLTLDAGATAAVSPVRSTRPRHRVDLAFVGDIHTLRRVNYSAQRPNGGWDFTPMFAEVAPLLQSADTAVCHMEAPIAPPGAPVIVVPPLLSTAAPMADALAGAGFDRCSTAGNHIMDRGVAGIDATLGEFDRVGISQSGAARSPGEARPEAAIYDVDGVAVAHLSYSWYIGGRSVPASQPWRANRLTTWRVIADARVARASGCAGRGHELHMGRRPGRVADRVPALGRAGRHRIGRGRLDRRAAGARAPADREGQRRLGDLRDGQLPQRSPGRFVPTGGR